jgi:hypothetical protein
MNLAKSPLRSKLNQNQNQMKIVIDGVSVKDSRAFLDSSSDRTPLNIWHRAFTSAFPYELRSVSLLGQDQISKTLKWDRGGTSKSENLFKYLVTHFFHARCLVVFCLKKNLKMLL